MSLAAQHRMLRNLADDLSNGAASETRDMDSYLLAMIRALLDGGLPCDPETRARLQRLRTLATWEGFA